MIDLKVDLNAEEPVDTLYAELVRRTSGDMSQLVIADLKDLCVAAECLSGIHNKRNSDKSMEGMVKTLTEVLQSALKPPKPCGHGD